MASRSYSSIAAAISGLFLRNCFELSRPWPMRFVPYEKTIGNIRAISRLAQRAFSAPVSPSLSRQRDRLPTPPCTLRPAAHDGVVITRADPNGRATMFGLLRLRGTRGRVPREGGCRSRSVSASAWKRPSVATYKGAQKNLPRGCGQEVRRPEGRCSQPAGCSNRCDLAGTERQQRLTLSR
jgi:hypothetical protein